ncbi:hypothetical protein PAHAL_1G193300 [Panicum hallii]|uniref:Uncharacterized protein n=1 Tax=Panicum hallii TaxID=206008 RepID=A0A2S3GPK1_9POAL|nr:hypothetical protein PAHAL_1G193300 [Panicum hallii]
MKARPRSEPAAAAAPAPPGSSYSEVLFYLRQHHRLITYPHPRGYLHPVTPLLSCPRRALIADTAEHAHTEASPPFCTFSPSSSSLSFWSGFICLAVLGRLLLYVLLIEPLIGCFLWITDLMRR